MKRRDILFAAVLAFVLTKATIADLPSFPICTNSADQWQPAISGDIVVWRDKRNRNWDIYGYNLSTGTEFTICTNSSLQGDPAISGDIVVWPDQRGGYDIYGYNLSTWTEFPICIGVPHASAPSVNGKTVAWYDYRNGNWDIYGYDLSMGTEFPICTDSATQLHPTVSSETVVWRDERNGEHNWDIYGYDLSKRAEFAICTNGASQLHPTISGDIVVWNDKRNGEDNGDIYGYNLSTGTEFPICTEVANQDFPVVSGDTVVWHDSRSGNWDIYGYNLSTGTEFSICTSSFYQAFPAISGDIVVWTDQRNGNTDIYGAIIPKPPTMIEAAVDIKPGSCPNPVNVKSKGVLPIAILGTADVNVLDIDPTSVRLAGVEPIRSGYEDVATPVSDSNDCNCITDGPDGFLDLTLKFETQKIVEAVGDVNDGDVRVLTLTGVLFDPMPFETPIEGADCILIRGRHKPINRADINKDGVVNAADFAIIAENWLQSSIVND